MNNLKFNLAKETFEDGLLDSTSYVLTVDTTCTAGTLFTNDCNDERNNISDVDYMLMFVSAMINRDFSVEEAFDKLMKKELRLKNYEFLTNKHLEILTYMSDALKEISNMCNGSLFSTYSKYLAELIDSQIKMEFVSPKALYLTNATWIDSEAAVHKQSLFSKVSELSVIFDPTPVDKKKLTEIYREFCNICGIVPLFGKDNSVVLRTNGFIDANLSIDEYQYLCQYLIRVINVAQLKLSKKPTSLTKNDLDLVYAISAYLTRTEMYLPKSFNDVMLKINDEIEIASRGEYHVLAMFKGCLKICIDNNYPPMMIASYMRMLGEDVSSSLTLFLNSTVENPVSTLYTTYARRILDSLYILEEKDFPTNPRFLYRTENYDDVFLFHKGLLSRSSFNGDFIYLNPDKLILEMLNDFIIKGILSRDMITKFNSSGDIVIKKVAVGLIDKELRDLMF